MSSYENLIKWFIENGIKLDDVCNLLFLSRRQLLDKLYLNDDDFTLLEIATICKNYKIRKSVFKQLFTPVEYFEN